MRDVRVILVTAMLCISASACGGDDKKDLPDGSAVCKSGELNCDGECADLDTSPKHCGSCDMACPAPEGADATCVAGKCGITCKTAETDAGKVEMTACDGMCVDVQTDTANCGNCGTECPKPKADGSAVCETGKCGLDCEEGYDACGTDCANLVVDHDHCGKCDNACNSNEVCANGKCVFSCPSGQTACGQSCVDLKTNADNCGGCGNACADPGGTATAACVNYQCTAKCGTGTTLCDGKCVSTKTDINNCGGCGKQCSSKGGTAKCTNGACGITCTGDNKNCDNDVKNGCESNSMTDAENCGDCTSGTGMDCTATASPLCDNGSCSAGCSGSLTACPTGTPDHCADTTGDVGDCGGCGMACGAPASGATSGTAACKSSACDVICRAPTSTKCTVGNDLACVDKTSDPQACGGCDTQCGNGEKCVSSACTADQCAIGLTKNNAGCVNQQTNGTYCGSSNTACNGTLIGTSCTLGTCFCDGGTCKNACSGGGKKICNTRDCVDTDSDPANCGGCGKACKAGQFCESGACHDFIYASDCWECGAGNSMDKCCSYAGGSICTDHTACPQ